MTGSDATAIDLGIIGVTFDPNPLPWKYCTHLGRHWIQHLRGLSMDLSGSGLEDLIGWDHNSHHIAIFLNRYAAQIQPCCLFRQVGICLQGCISTKLRWRPGSGSSMQSERSTE